MKVRFMCMGILIALLAATCALAQENKSTVSANTTVTDVDGNVYKTVIIGNQVWMAEDLKTTRYRNGDVIGTTSPATLDISSESTPKYQWAYAGDESHVATYGRLYTWYAATDSRNVCPASWHVSTEAEWKTLIDFLGGEKVAQGKLKEAGTTHWNSPNSDATNESGFTALPGGNRFNKEPFLGLGDFTHWWTATEYDAKFAWRRTLWKNASMDNTGGYADKKNGWLVRCVKDASTLPSASLAAQDNKSTVSANASQPPPSAGYLELQGEVLGQIDQTSASIAYYSADKYVSSLRESGRAIPHQTTEIMAAAKTALDSGDHYRALRLLARAVGWTEGEQKIEAYDVAASFRISLNRAIFADGENITLTLRPLFTLGHPLKGSYIVYSWLETKEGAIAGTEQKLPVTELKEYHFDFPVRSLKDGVIAVGYRLVSSDGETLAQFRHAVVVFKDAGNYSQKLLANLTALKQQAGASPSPAFQSALDTLEQTASNLELDRTRFDGHWMHMVHPLGPSIWLKADPKSGWADFPALVARLRYPEDIDFAEPLARDLRADHDALLKKKGEMIFAARSKNDRVLLRYRIYVPPGYDSAKKYSLVLALHSGFSDDEFFRPDFLSSGEKKGQENRLFRLAQDRNYIIVTPNGERTNQQFSGEPGCSDVVDIAEQVRGVYSIPTDRVFLTSWSTGSYASWEIAMKYTEHFRAIAPVGGEAKWLNKENTGKGQDVPILYSIAESEATQGRATAKLAGEFLHNFVYKEYPGTGHGSVWYVALPAIFDFFDTSAAGSSPSRTDTNAVKSHKASFQGLGDFPDGAFESMASRVSADGSIVVGNGTTASGKQAFHWTESQGMVSLGNLPNGSFKQSWASAVSADGSVIVGYGDPDGSGWNGHKGFRWTQSGGMADTGSLNGSTRYEALDVSADGSVVVGDGGQQAFRWTQSGGIVGLGVLPGRTNSRAIAMSTDGSVVVGSSYNLPSWDKQETFIWTQSGGMQGLGYLPGGSTSFPNAISADGSVIAGTSDSSSGWSAFRWTRSTGMVDIGHLPGRNTTHPGAVSADGSIIVGASFVDRDHATAFIWDSTHGMRSLQSVLETDYGLNLNGWNLQNASGITPDGSVIVGWGTNPSGRLEAFRAVLVR